MIICNLQNSITRRKTLTVNLSNLLKEIKKDLKNNLDVNQLSMRIPL